MSPTRTISKFDRFTSITNNIVNLAGVVAALAPVVLEIVKAARKAPAEPPAEALLPLEKDWQELKQMEKPDKPEKPNPISQHITHPIRGLTPGLAKLPSIQLDSYGFKSTPAFDPSPDSAALKALVHQIETLKSALAAEQTRQVKQLLMQQQQKTEPTRLSAEAAASKEAWDSKESGEVS